MSIKYSKAPISEVSFGIVFDTHTLLLNSIIFELLIELRNSFPFISVRPASDLQEVIGGNLQNTADYNSSGFAMYQLINVEKQRQFFIQHNSFSFNWVRKDDQPIGNYPGFTQLYSEFKGIMNLLEKLFNKFNIDYTTSLKNYFLNYSDRINVSAYGEKGVWGIINISNISFQANNKIFHSNNIINTYTTKCDAINGDIVTTFNSPTIGPEQLLLISNNIDGILNDKKDIDGWFSIARELQINFFDSIIKKEVLDDWK